MLFIHSFLHLFIHVWWPFDEAQPFDEARRRGGMTIRPMATGAKWGTDPMVTVHMNG
jgi:hypothetical protein